MNLRRNSFPIPNICKDSPLCSSDENCETWGDEDGDGSKVVIDCNMNKVSTFMYIGGSVGGIIVLVLCSRILKCCLRQLRRPAIQVQEEDPEPEPQPNDFSLNPIEGRTTHQNNTS